MVREVLTNNTFASCSWPKKDASVDNIRDGIVGVWLRFFENNDRISKGCVVDAWLNKAAETISFSETKLIVEFRVRQMENVRSEREKQLGNSSRIIVLSKCSFTREIVRSACEQRKLYSVQHHYEYF